MDQHAVVVLRNKAGLSPEEAAKWKTGKEQKGTVNVHHLEIEGPPEAVHADPGVRQAYLGAAAA